MVAQSRTQLKQLSSSSSSSKDRVFPGGLVKYLPAKARDAGDEVPSLGQEDPLAEEMAIHSSVLA